MSTAANSIKQGLKEAIEHAKGNSRVAIQYTPKHVDVKKVREKIGMSQQLFSTTFGISLGTLRHWEQGDRYPRGPALVLLNLIAGDHETILSLLRPR